MTDTSIAKIELKEIKDYRGNLCFAEEGHPIPFTIKSVFWSTLSSETIFNTTAQSFIICLDGTLTVRGNETIELTRPHQGILLAKEQTVTLAPTSKEAMVVIVMDETINQEDASTEKNKNLLTMPHIADFHGMSGYFANTNTTIPFDLKRIYFTYDIPESAERGGHAHKELESAILALSGQFNLSVEGTTNQSITLDSKKEAFFLKKDTWRDIKNFKNKCILLVLASDVYDESDYIREYPKFKAGQHTKLNFKKTVISL